MRTTADAVVIGAGVIGSSVALELTRAGFAVVVVDKAGGIGHGSTSASSAIVRFNYSTWTGVAAAWESLHCWRDWAAHVESTESDGIACFVRTGCLVVGSVTTTTTHLFDRAGVPWESWGPKEIQKRLPAVDNGAFGPPKPVDSEEFLDGPVGMISGVYTPDAGYVNDPVLATGNLAAAAVRGGARYLMRRRVTDIIERGTGRWQVRTGDDSIDTGIIVNAAGPWSGEINELAGIGGDFTVTTRPLRQEVHHVSAPAGFNTTDKSGPVIADLDLGIYLRSAPGGGLLVGGTEPECDPLEWIDDPDVSDPRPTPARFESQVTRAGRRLPDLRIPNRPSGVAGVYDATTDWAPIYDKTSKRGFYVAIGTSGNQFKNAPVVGQLMATLITAVEDGHDHDAEPIRFTAPRTGNLLELAAYSRLRPVDDRGPTSVMG